MEDWLKIGRAPNCDYMIETDMGLNISNFPVCLFKIVALFADDCDNNIVRLDIDRNSLYIKGINDEGKSCELMLRLRPFPPIGLVVARIEFIHKRQGKFTKLISILENIRQQYGLGEIMIESGMSKDIINWLQKNDWKRYQLPNYNYISPEAYKRITEERQGHFYEEE